jgi:hypothetical protein
MLTGGGQLWARGPAGTVVSPQFQVNGSNSVGNVRLHSKGRAAQNMVRGSNKSAS